MIDIKRLLRFTPDEAILMLANERMKTYLRPEISKVSQLKAISGSRTQVLIESKDVHLDMVQNPYIGASVLEYNRYDLTVTFGTITSDLQVPTTVESLLATIHKATGIVFTKDDFENDSIETKEFWLIASPNSKRWVGAVKVTFDDSALGVRIGKYLSMNSHEGLTHPGKPPLWSAFHNNILDGLDRGKPHLSFIFTNQHDGLVSDIRIHVDDYLSTLDHQGLVTDIRMDVADYLRSVDHKGLVTGIELSEYLPITDHGGLNSDNTGTYLIVNNHSGLFSGAISGYLRNTRHQGLHHSAIKSYLRVKDHQGLGFRPIGQYLSNHYHGGLSYNTIGKYLGVNDHLGLGSSTIGDYLYSKDHVGLVNLPYMNDYLTTTDHKGLGRFKTTLISDYLVISNHDGLNSYTTLDVGEYLTTSTHGGLTSYTYTGIDGYLTTSKHQGLNTLYHVSIGSYLSTAEHVGLNYYSDTSINVYLSESDHAGLMMRGMDNISDYLTSSSHRGLAHDYTTSLDESPDTTQYNLDGYEL